MTSPGVIAALDLGTRFTGIALAQPHLNLALPHAVLEAQGFAQLWQKIQLVPAFPQIGAWVLGLPLHASGAPSAQSDLVQKFARYLSYRHPAPIWLVDERLTSQAARRTSSLERHDAEAASLILAGYLSAPHLAQRGGDA